MSYGDSIAVMVDKVKDAADKAYETYVNAGVDEEYAYLVVKKRLERALMLLTDI